MITSNKFQFFPGQRRRVQLVDWKPLNNAQSEKRVRLDFLMELTGQPLLGIPDFVAPDYENMERENSKTTESDIGVELEGVTVDVFSTDNTPAPMEAYCAEGSFRVTFTAATLRKFQVVRITRDKVGLVCLSFSVTVKSSDWCVVWARTYHDATFYAAFTETQPTIPEAKPEDAQLELKPAESPEITEAVGTRTALEREGKACPYVEKGMACTYEIDHDGEHVLAAPVDLVGAARGKGKRV